jgi:cation:H+ antiporter
MIYPLISLALGLIGLWIGSRMAVRGYKNIAHYFGLSYLFVGLTMVAIGTSLPEIAVSVIGAIDQLRGIEMSGIVVGNKIGSYITQGTLVVGIVGSFAFLSLTKRELKREGGMLILSAVLFSLVSLDLEITRMEGIFLISAYLLYVCYLVREVHHIGRVKRERTKGVKRTKKGYIKNFLMIGVGMCILLYAAEIVTSSSVQLAELLGVPYSLIGLLIIGPGTSLPELSIEITSILKGARGIAMGDIIGSNICDILLSMGAGTVISGFSVDPVMLWFDIPFMFLITFLLLGLLKTKMKLERREAPMLLAIYISYVYLKLVFFMK